MNQRKCILLDDMNESVDGLDKILEAFNGALAEFKDRFDDYCSNYCPNGIMQVQVECHDSCEANQIMNKVLSRLESHVEFVNRQMGEVL